MIDVKNIVNHRLLSLAPYEPGKSIASLQREQQIERVIKLASNENPIGAGESAGRAALHALADIALYPDGSGFELKQTLSKALNVDPNYLTLGNGSDNILALLVQAFAKPHSKIIISEYGFSTFSIIARANHADPVFVKSRDYGHDLAAMAAAVTPDTAMLMIANPNNPTGTNNTEAELVDLLQSVPSNVLVIVDEAYCEYNLDPNYPDTLALQAKFHNLVITRTFSKIYGLAGLRIGYGISHPEIADYLNRIRLPFNVSVPGLAAATAAILDLDHIKKSLDVVNEGRIYLQDQFKQLGLRFLPAHGNFLTVDMGSPGVPIYQGLLNKGIIVRPLIPYNMPNHLRITIGTAEQNHYLCQALAEVLNNIK